MTFQMQATGFRDFDANMKSIARAFSPQAGIADVLDDGAEVIVIAAKDNAAAQGLIESGALIDSIRTLKINQFRVDVIVAIVYGAAHEFGVTVTITAKQRRFFWAQWIRTKEEMWLALALSKTYTIPARPYLRPAIDEDKGAALAVMGRSTFVKLRRAVQ
jgi:phage gpG-like protein